MTQRQTLNPTQVQTVELERETELVATPTLDMIMARSESPNLWDICNRDEQMTASEKLRQNLELSDNPAILRRLDGWIDREQVVEIAYCGICGKCGSAMGKECYCAKQIRVERQVISSRGSLASPSLAGKLPA